MKPIFWILLVGAVLVVAGLAYFASTRRTSQTTTSQRKLPTGTAAMQTTTSKPPSSPGSMSLGANTTPQEQRNTGSGSMGYTLLTPVKPMLVPDQCKNLCISIVGYGAEDFNSPKRGEWEKCEQEICGWRRPHHFCNHQFENESWSLKN